MHERVNICYICRFRSPLLREIIFSHTIRKVKVNTSLIPPQISRTNGHAKMTHRVVEIKQKLLVGDVHVPVFSAAQMSQVSYLMCAYLNVFL